MVMKTIEGVFPIIEALNCNPYEAAWGWAPEAHLDEVYASPVIDKLRHRAVVAAIELLELHQQAPRPMLEACLRLGAVCRLHVWGCHVQQSRC